MLPITSINAASATGAGTARDLEGSLAHHTALVDVTGGNASVALEGSHDGSVWVGLASAGGGSPFVLHADRVVRHVRANFTTINSGSPVVTVTIASA